MNLFEGKTPGERKKIIAALTLAPLMLLFLAYQFGLLSSSKKTNTTVKRASTAAPGGAQSSVGATSTEVQEIRDLQSLRPVIYNSETAAVADVGRNIFAYYGAPTTNAGGSGSKQIAVATSPTPTMMPAASPTPPPPVLLAGLNPSNVFARTSSFRLEVSGDKFTPATKIYFNGNELPTEFASGQLLRTQVPASLIDSEGGRAIIVRTPDSQLYSNTANLNVMQPPAPQFTYVGILGRKQYDIAVLKNQKGELLNVQRGDTVGGRFKLTNISERAVEFTDTELSIKHTLRSVDTKTPNAPVGSVDNFSRNIQPPPPNKATLSDDDDDFDDEDAPERKKP